MATVCPRICIAGLRGRPLVTAEPVSVAGGRPVIRLSLRKPRAWDWKLTTSASSPAVVCCVVDVVGDPPLTALDRARHWNQPTNQGSSTESETETERERERRRHRRKNDSGYKSLRRGRGRGPSAVRRGEEREAGDSSNRSGKEVDTGTSSVRRRGDLEDNPVRRGKDMDTGNSSERRRGDNEDSLVRRGKDMDTGNSSVRRRGDNDDNPVRRGKDMDTGNSSVRRKGDNEDSLVRRGQDMDTRNSLVRRRGESDIGQLSLIRGKDLDSSHSSLRRVKEMDSKHSSLRRVKEMDSKHSLLRRGTETDRKDSSFRSGVDIVSLHSSFKSGEGTDSNHSSLRRGKEMDIQHSSLRRGVDTDDSRNSSLRRCKEIDNKYSSLRRGKEMDSQHSSLRRGVDTDSKCSSLRRGVGTDDSRNSPIRRGKEMDSQHSSLRRGVGTDDSHNSSIRRGKEMDSQHSPLRRGVGTDDSRNSSLRRGQEMESQQLSVRRGVDADIGYCSLTRGRESPAVSEAESTRRGRRTTRRDCSWGHDDDDDAEADAGRPPPRRPRRRRRPPLRAMGANVSRQGLTGRRTQSSGNLCNGNKILGGRDVGKGLCGSLPNYLDDDNNNQDAMNARLSDQKRGLELRLLPQDAALQDQGYASERSPEDEHPPVPPPYAEVGAEEDCISFYYPFITPDSVFEVTLSKGNQGLGLSVTGGIETAEQWPGLIRIKRLFPHQPAWLSGQLESGDILLTANGVRLIGLTNYQALEVLRTSPSNVVLDICRPPCDVFSVAAPSSEPPLPPRRDTSYTLSSSQMVVPLPLLQIEEPCGEFDIILQKVNRSLGFTLRKEDESVLGHYVRALVREPALSDGRIRPGDKIVEVNDVPLSPMSHEEAVTFLRQCGETVKLRLYRDAAQTPVAALSPSDPEPPGCVRPRPTLRQEARDMLTDLAVRKLSPTNSSSSMHGGGGGLLQCLSGGSTPGASPRRRRLTKTPSPDIATAATQRLGGVYREGEGEGEALPQRPHFLDLQTDGESPQGQRRPKYTFAVPEIRGGEEGLTEQPASLPPLSSTSTASTAFSYRNPAYHSANPIRAPDEGEAMTECSSERDVSGEGGEGSCGLLKWKGVVFTPGGGEDERVVMVELTRGWNSRLGFSLRADGSRTYVSAVYADSVAAKDGRLRPHDRLITVNDENVETMTTGEIIDLLRKIRGTIEIRVARRSGPTRSS